MQRTIIVIICLSLSGFASAQRFDDEVKQPNKHGILFYDGFESGCWDANNPGPEVNQSNRCPGKAPQWRQAQLQSPYAAEIIKDTVRSGEHAIRFKWLKDNPGQWIGDYEEIANTEKKAMLHGPGVKDNQGSERWYGWSMYFPSTGMKKDKHPRLIFQLHASPDHHLDEPWRQPVTSMNLSNEGMTVSWAYDTARVSPKNENIIANRQGVDIEGDYEQYLDRWVDIVWHVKVDYTPKKTGLIEVWIDGKQVVDKHNIQLGYNDDQGLYPSWGMYWYRGKAEYDHWLYVDEVRIGGPEAAFEDVLPGKN